MAAYKETDLSKLSETMQRALKDLEDVSKQLVRLSDAEKERRIYALVSEQEPFETD